MALTKSWHHAITRLTRRWIGLGCSGRIERGSCPATPEYEASYACVSGARGRAQTRRRWYCSYHAARFCRLHKLRLPEDT
jgi:hypothetical protein